MAGMCLNNLIRINSTHRFRITRLTSCGSSNIVDSGIIIYNKYNLTFLRNCFCDKNIKSF